MSATIPFAQYSRSSLIAFLALLLNTSATVLVTYFLTGLSCPPQFHLLAGSLFFLDCLPGNATQNNCYGPG